METSTEYKKHIYWVPGDEFIKLKDDLESTETGFSTFLAISCALIIVSAK